MNEFQENAGRGEVLSALYAGLRMLSPGVFPKKCNCCGAAYRDFDEFIAKTAPMPRQSGLAEVPTEDMSAAVGLYRNCSCGSTLMLICGDRRDVSSHGIARRASFDKLLAMLAEKGVAPGIARHELFKIVHGGRSELVEGLLK